MLFTNDSKVDIKARLKISEAVFVDAPPVSMNAIVVTLKLRFTLKETSAKGQVSAKSRQGRLHIARHFSAGNRNGRQPVP